jgi:hypothetical protein
MRRLLLPLSARYIAYTSVLLVTAILLFEFLAGYKSFFVVVPLVLLAALSTIAFFRCTRKVRVLCDCEKISALDAFPLGHASWLGKRSPLR